MEPAAGRGKNEASVLDKLLADEYVLYMRTRDGSRNIPESSPFEVHELFRGQCESMSSIVAGVSRMVRVFGPMPSFVHEKFMAITRLNAHGGPFAKQNEVIEALLDDHESIIHILRNDKARHEDLRTVISTAEFMAGLLKQHEEMAGALKGWLQ